MDNELTIEEKAEFIQMIRYSERARQLSDGELIDAVCVNCTYPLRSSEQALIDELSTRFQKAIGLKMTPLGIESGDYSTT